MDKTFKVEGINVLIGSELEEYSEDLLVEYRFLDKIEKLHVKQIK